MLLNKIIILIDHLFVKHLLDQAIPPRGVFIYLFIFLAWCVCVFGLSSLLGLISLCVF